MRFGETYWWNRRGSMRLPWLILGETSTCSLDWWIGASLVFHEDKSTPLSSASGPYIFGWTSSGTITVYPFGLPLRLVSRLVLAVAFTAAVLRIVAACRIHDGRQPTRLIYQCSRDPSSTAGLDSQTMLLTTQFIIRSKQEVHHVLSHTVSHTCHAINTKPTEWRYNATIKYNNTSTSGCACVFVCLCAKCKMIFSVHQPSGKWMFTFFQPVSGLSLFFKTGEWSKSNLRHILLVSGWCVSVFAYVCVCVCVSVICPVYSVPQLYFIIQKKKKEKQGESICHIQVSRYSHHVSLCMLQLWSYWGVLTDWSLCRTNQNHLCPDMTNLDPRSFLCRWPVIIRAHPIKKEKINKWINDMTSHCVLLSGVFLNLRLTASYLCFV